MFPTGARAAWGVIPLRFITRTAQEKNLISSTSLDSALTGAGARTWEPCSSETCESVRVLRGNFPYTWWEHELGWSPGGGSGNTGSRGGDPPLGDPSESRACLAGAPGGWGGSARRPPPRELLSWRVHSLCRRRCGRGSRCGLTLLGETSEGPPRLVLTRNVEAFAVTQSGLRSRPRRWPGSPRPRRRPVLLSPPHPCRRSSVRAVGRVPRRRFPGRMVVRSPHLRP